jgi:hypothetical protein
MMGGRRRGGAFPARVCAAAGLGQADWPNAIRRRPLFGRRVAPPVGRAVGELRRADDRLAAEQSAATTNDP